ncbi:MAG TPA: tetratricopeptide repeat protein [Candidatus Krumholzibacteria bacterium]|nr:tetratricopeptide repeat protein [Candidatus Krumholzibacteria bacterium]HPD70420.1 tetratricopeptide repeat protein [Candidatus Krumholzibacteria bacterium]HRY39880.1 tetratricopeptide repeat protein [Candidatus Krumholzibacteria bacterium]
MRAANRPLVVAALVFAATLAVFLPAVGNGFVEWDDPFTVRDNPHLRSLGGDNLAWMFGTTYWGHYQPLVWLSYAIDHAWSASLLGSGGQPAAYHATSVLWHAVAAALVAWLGLLLLETAAPPRVAAFAAGTAALVYGLHPLRVEAVAWATGRGDVLVSVFLTFSTLAYVRSRRSARRATSWFTVSLVAYALASLARGSAITFPAVLVVLDVFPLRRLGGAAGWSTPAARRVWLEKVPFAVLAAGFSVLAVEAKASVGSLTPLAWHGPLDRVVQACYGLVFYLRKTLLPLGLSPIYEIRLPLQAVQARFLFSIAAVVLLVGLVWIQRRRWPAVAAVAAAYALLLVPVLGFGQAGNQLAADRYATLAAIPVALGCGAGVAVLLRRATDARRRAIHLGVVAVLACLAFLSVRQIGVWRDSDTLWTHAARQSPESSIALNGRGWVLLQAKRYGEAEACFRRAIALQPTNDKAHENLWDLLREQGREEDLIEALTSATRTFPDLARAHYLLGVALMEAGRPAAAATAYEAALQHDPGHVRARSNLGQILLDQGDAAGALAHLERAVAADPADAVARNRLAVALDRQGRRADAIRELEQVLRFDPDNRSARDLLRRYRTEGH